MLIEYGSEGLPAGHLSERLGIPHNTLSFHLSHLSHAGLINSRKDGRSIIYSADCDAIEGLVSFLVANCCSQSGSSIECAPQLFSRATVVNSK